MTFNNFYSIENLELTYTLSHKTLAELLRKSQVINPIDKFVETLATNVYQDSYYETKKKTIIAERKKMIQAFKSNKIDYYPSDTNYILIKTNSSKYDVVKSLEERNIMLYTSKDTYYDYWTLPLSTPENNEIILDVLIYSNI